MMEKNLPGFSDFVRGWALSPQPGPHLPPSISYGRSRVCPVVRLLDFNCEDRKLGIVRPLWKPDPQPFPPEFLQFLFVVDELRMARDRDVFVPVGIDVSHEHAVVIADLTKLRGVPER